MSKRKSSSLSPPPYYDVASIVLGKAGMESFTPRLSSKAKPHHHMTSILYTSPSIQKQIFINACIYGKLDYVNFLLNNTNIKKDSKIMQEALANAVLNREYNIVKTLIKNGAKVTSDVFELSNSVRIISYLRTLKKFKPESYSIILNNAAREGNLNTIKYLKYLKVPDKDNEAIFIASINGYLDIVQYLATHGSDASDYLDNGAVRQADINGHKNVVRYLLTLPGVHL